MRKQELIASVVVSLILGLGMVLILSGGNISVYKPTEAMQTETPIVHPDTKPTSTAFTGTAATSTPTTLPVVVSSRKGEDLDDLLLLYDSTRSNSFDNNFYTIAKYYGLLCKVVSLDTTNITDETLRDPQGNYYKLVGISAANLLRVPPILSENEIKALKFAISAGGINLLISGVNSGLDPAALSELTDGAVYDATQPQDSKRDWLVSSALPEITREFSGQTITSTSKARQGDFALLVEQPTATLISSKDNMGAEYPVFIRWNNGGGSIFIDSGERGKSLDKLPLREIYYDSSNFSNILPTMLALRYAAGEEAWHNNHNYANLTLDGPTLTEPFHNLSYPALLREMDAHNFHTTIALIPAKWQSFNFDVVTLFQLHPDRFSLVQHGNNHDGYEFYRYSLTVNDPKDDPNFRARPLKRLSDILGIPSDPVMIFPYGISPEPTLVLLKKYNYLATVNQQDLPLDATRPSTWDYGMYPAEMYYGNFPTLTRRQPGTYQPFQPDIQPFIFDLFVDKPALFYSHAYEDELFADGIDAFDPVADQMNRLAGGVEWQSLDYIVKHLYLEKRNDDGSMDVRMYANDLILKNEYDSEQVYHFSKEEILNVPIARLTVNDQEFPYYMEKDLLKLDVRIPASTFIEIEIRYGN
jgi:hypothetical protein